MLLQHFHDNKQRIETWFAEHWEITPPPVYGSIDLRHAGFKIAPVDMNLFPAGFNNLDSAAQRRSAKAAKLAILHHAPHTKRILLITENHTRNPFYWENIKTLVAILELAGFLVQSAMLTQVKRDHHQLMLADFAPDVILLNHDLSDGLPAVLQNLDQPMMPPAAFGWYRRFKSTYFQYYDEVANEFAALLQIDPWLLRALFKYCEPVDFMGQSGLDTLLQLGEALFEEIQKKYLEHRLIEEPFLIIKADQGTYGMAVMTIRHPSELKSLNRKRRSHMSESKGGRMVQRVMLQEGVPTIDTAGSLKSVAEPVLYLWGSTVVGGFYRVHEKRGIDENLNSPGMHFEPLPLLQCYVHDVMARLGMLAAARELGSIAPAE
ncbi:MAG: glutamate--cysteine ligase [Gammaproteobacteria bacterium RIFCSPHIGHO2_12_FULL_42_10]|nr:MAG: glutamate--cysteine ligase [Gammaproteobacteria bacterium RIFCSPHIGHO2_12_FULL_42_10]